MGEELITKKQKIKLQELLTKHKVAKPIDSLTKGQAAQLINKHQKWHKLSDEEKSQS